MSVRWGPNLHYVAPKAKYALPDCDFKIQINSASFVADGPRSSCALKIGTTASMKSETVYLTQLHASLASAL